MIIMFILDRQLLNLHTSLTFGFDLNTSCCSFSHTKDHREIAKKWENLRRSYRRHCNVKKTSKKSGSAANEDTDFNETDDEDDGIWEKMQFLEPYMKLIFCDKRAPSLDL